MEIQQRIDYFCELIIQWGEEEGLVRLMLEPVDLNYFLTLKLASSRSCCGLLSMLAMLARRKPTSTA